MRYGTPQPIAEVKASGDAWEVSGYVSTFGNVDLGGDVVVAGAFDRTLAEWKAGTNKVRFLRQHDSSQVLGVPLELKVDSTGLFGRFKISRTQLGEETRTLLKDGALDSFSMGYRAAEVDFAENGDVRKLLEVDLLESSIVAIPMNPDALVSGVKSLDDLVTLPFVEQCQFLVKVQTAVADSAKALRERRIGDGRDFNAAHIAGLRAALPGVEASGAELKALIDAAAEVEAERGSEQPLDGTRLRLALARRRAVHAGLLERTTP